MARSRISREAARSLAIRYAAFQITLENPEKRADRKMWAGMLHEIQQETGIVLAPTAETWAKWEFIS